MSSKSTWILIACSDAPRSRFASVAEACAQHYDADACDFLSSAGLAAAALSLKAGDSVTLVLGGHHPCRGLERQLASTKSDRILDRLRVILEAHYGGLDEAGLHNALVQENQLCQIETLCSTEPFASAVRERRLKIHPLIEDHHDGMFIYDASVGQFAHISQASTQPRRLHAVR